MIKIPCGVTNKNEAPEADPATVVPAVVAAVAAPISAAAVVAAAAAPNSAAAVVAAAATPNSVVTTAAVSPPYIQHSPTVPINELPVPKPIDHFSTVKFLFYSSSRFF